MNLVDTSMINTQNMNHWTMTRYSGGF